MSTNNYFKNFNSFPQQELLNDLSREVIQMSGSDVLYLPRFVVKNDDILGEDTLSKFTLAFEIEMYINNTDSYGGAGDIASKFGLDIQDEVVLVVNKERFKNETSIAVPKEGDLIYIPLTKGLFEIKFVEHEKPFYSLGKNTIFELTCEKFQYSDEKFEIPAGQLGGVFDKFERQHSITMSVTLASGSGKYTAGETVYQGVSVGTATGKGFVSSFNSTTNVINIYNKIGTFVSGSNLIGVTSTTSRNIDSADDQDIITSQFSSNKEFETEGDNILDFSEVDPWSEGDL